MSSIKVLDLRPVDSSLVLNSGSFDELTDAELKLVNGGGWWSDLKRGATSVANGVVNTAKKLLPDPQISYNYNRKTTPNGETVNAGFDISFW